MDTAVIIRACQRCKMDVVDPQFGRDLCSRCEAELVVERLCAHGWTEQPMPTYRSSLFPTFRERLLYAFVCTCASFMNWMEGAVAGWGLSLLVLGGCLYFWWHILRWMFS